MNSIRKLTRIRGEARLETVRPKTGSEHEGVVLETPEGKRWLLVRIGGNPFNDPETRKLAGQSIEVEGYCVGAELRYLSVRDLS